MQWMCAIVRSVTKVGRCSLGEEGGNFFDVTLYRGSVQARTRCRHGENGTCKKQNESNQLRNGFRAFASTEAEEKVVAVSETTMM